MNLKPGLTYSFDVYAPQILGSDFQNVLLLDVLSYRTASLLRDVEAKHAELGTAGKAPNTPNNPANYGYVQVLTQSGNTVVLGQPWIREESIVSVSSDIIDVTVSNVTAADMPFIRQCLAANGYNEVDVNLRPQGQVPT